MVTFVSLFLWLVIDTQMVQVAVDPGVAAVEIFLDDRSVGVIDVPPWQLQCDFGPILRPHELVAVWSVEKGAADGVWGPVSDISDLGKLTKVSRRLLEGIQGKWVVWVEGRHLPGAIELASNPIGLELAQ